MAVYPGEQDKEILLAGEGGQLVRVSISGGKASRVLESWGLEGERYSICISDFNRDGSVDAFLVGSYGSINLVGWEQNRFKSMEKFPSVVSRSSVIRDSLGGAIDQTTDGSPPAVADLNKDGYPEVIFTIPNGATAINYTGSPLAGWPFIFDKRQNSGLLAGGSLYAPSVISSSPLVVSLEGEPTVILASPDGAIEAIKPNGSRLNTTSLNPDLDFFRYAAPAAVETRDWPLATGMVGFDSTQSPYIHLWASPRPDTSGIVLLAKSSAGLLDMWYLPKGQISENSWSGWGNNGSRDFYFESSALAKPEQVNTSDIIHEFHLYPSPLRGGIAKIHLDLGAPATKAMIKVFDLTGEKVAEKTLANFPYASVYNAELFDLTNLGPDVYSVMVEVFFRLEPEKRNGPGLELLNRKKFS